MHELTEEIINSHSACQLCVTSKERVDIIVVSWLEKRCEDFDKLFMSKDGYLVGAKSSSLKKHLGLPEKKSLEEELGNYLIAERKLELGGLERVAAEIVINFLKSKGVKIDD